MPLDLIREIVNNRFLLILMEERAYVSKLEEIIKTVEKTRTKICYICMSKPFSDVADDLEGKGFNIKDFFFVDVLSSHYKAHAPADNCIFVSSPNDLSGIREAVKKATNEKKCSVILFDTISTLLIYEDTSSIVKFTHHLVTDDVRESVKKLFIVLKNESVSPEENQRLLSDLSMFADKAVAVE